MDKAALRKATIHTLNNLDPHKKSEIEAVLLQQLTATSAWQTAETIGVTISQGFEWDTKPIIEAAWKAGKHICAPKCTPKERKLTFYQFTNYNQLEVVYYDLLEPKANETVAVSKNEIDLLIVPGLIFDKKGYRIGFGGGYYDRYLADFSNQTLALACEAIQVVEAVPAEHFDIPVQQLVTEQGVYNIAVN